MKIVLISLVVFSAIVLFIGGCFNRTLESGTLSPGQIDSSMVDQVVEVQGKISLVVENPGGLGGLYLKLGDANNVSIRIQSNIWESFNENEKAQFKKGKTVTAEGILFKAGTELVVIFGKFSPPSSGTTNTK